MTDNTRIMLNLSEINMDDVKDVATLAALMVRGLMAAIEKSGTEDAGIAVVALEAATEAMVSYFAMDGKEVDCAQGFARAIVAIAQARVDAHPTAHKFGPFMIEIPREH